MLQLLYKVMQPCAIYRGVAITQCPAGQAGYKVFGNIYLGLQQAKDAVDEAYGALKGSIKTSAEKEPGKGLAIIAGPENFDKYKHHI
jgi:hypothetical protein